MKNWIKIGMFIILFASVLSCEKEDEELPPALKAEIAKISNCMCLPFFSKYIWRGEVVYFRGIRGAECLGFPIYYDKDGIRFELEAGYSNTKFSEDARLIKTVWECKL